MRRSQLMVLVLAAGSSHLACSKKTKTGKVSASLMKPQTVSASLALADEGMGLANGQGSMVQSFTPDSLKLPIYRVSMCSGSSDCVSLYTCAGSTAEACGVELSKIDAFVDAINAAGGEAEDGKSYDHVGVQFCPDGDSSGVQHITMSGTVSIAGKTYATDPTVGLVEGTSGKDVAIDIHGGCASYYPVTPSVTVSKDTPTTVKLFFDSSLYAFGGVSGGSYDGYVNGSCAGTTGAYVCGEVITVVPTVDSGNPTTEHYLIADTNAATGGSDSSSPTATMALYFSSAGIPVGGVENAYRVSGPSISWGHQLNGGLGLYPKAQDDGTLAIGEPGGSISLADWFKTFKRETHTGAYTYAGPGGASVDSTYKATRF